MHEVSVASALWKMCREERDQRAPFESRHIARVRIDVGELASVEPRLLELAWREVAREPGEPAPHLEVRACPARQTCTACGEVAERQPGSWLRLCPNCDRPLRVEGGDELDLVELVFEEPRGALSC